MNECKVFVGEDFALVGQLLPSSADESITLDDFHVRVELSTTALGRRIVGTSGEDAADLTIYKRDSNCFYLNVSHDLTSQLTPGELIVCLILTHKTTGIRMINEQRVVRVVDSRINQNYEH